MRAHLFFLIYCTVSGNMAHSDEPVWMNFTSTKEGIVELASANPRVTHVMGFRKELQNLVKDRGLCNLIVVRPVKCMESKWPLSWTHNKRVSNKLAQRLDGQAAGLRRGKSLFEKNDECEAEPVKLHVGVVFFLGVFFVLLFALPPFMGMVKAVVRRLRQSSQPHEARHQK